MSVNATVFNSSAIRVQWVAPVNAFGIIRGYIVNVGTDPTMVMNYTVGREDQTLVIGDLAPFTEYTVVVYARTLELGVPSEPDTVRTAEASKF